MNYSTLGFIESLKREKRSMWRAEFIEPYSGVTYGFIFHCWPVTILKVTGWHGEKIAALKIGKHEWTW